MTNQDKLLTEKEVLDIIPVSRTTWISGIAREIYPRAIYFGRRRFWRKEDIDLLKEKGTK